MPTLLSNRWVAQPQATLSPLHITTASIPGATVGTAYSTSLAATGGLAPYTFSLLSTVPNTGAWLACSSSGALSGTPGTAETETVLVQVADSLGTKASAFFALVIASSSGSPAFFQNFDSSTVGTSSALDNWGTNAVDNTQSFSTPNSYRLNATAGSGSFGASKVMAAGTSTPSQGDEVWFRVRVLFPTGFNFTATGGGGDALKFLRIDTGPAGNGHGSHIDWYLRGGTATNVGTFDYILEGVAQWLYGSGPTPIASGIVRNSWYTIEVYYKLHSVAANAIIRMWVNGTLIVDTNANLPSGVPRRATLNSSTDIIGNASNINCSGFMFVTYWNTQSPATQQAYLDDFTVYASNINGRPGATDAAGNTFIGMS